MSIPLFSPAAVDPDELDAHTVGRAALLSRLTDRITGAVRDGSRPHTLLLGPHGSGKTHTLHLVLYRALSDRETAKRTLPLILPEDSLAIGSYGDLLVELIRPHHPNASDLRNDVVALERAILDHADGRMILVAAENLDRVFAAIGTAGQGSLRAWVETSTAVTLFATAPALFRTVASRSHPWYGSFIVEELPALTASEGGEIVARANEELSAYVRSPEGQHRIAAIDRLISGSPRLWHIIADTADVPALQALTPVVAALMDRIAPSYQQRLWQLPTGEQRLVVELARGDGSRTVSDLAAAVGVSNQTASAALGRLANTRWVVAAKSEADRRVTYYDLDDPLLRHVVRYRERGIVPTP
ncbi:MULTISPECIES: MarR family transcriptional regulator [Mycobacterium]|uniref:MarR family transcriptional regulator n=1 Tax=Mycobacterium syngnathidarum TaxID=1908205 RepID=A0A1S1K2F5_9MYCO|nr:MULTISPECIES: MarR family transcriptional regulator [Mycobacterium]MCG7607706.1 MarR family transcriptional regulator [Mycobacterium sp. CnD-18-1]OHU01177.1 MarR family transcriptional regulator [Mycobacterium syngnathidarum]OLT95437.1 MarR family transcriptional regulator [Mycobacterium syngnathidarum]